MYNTISNKAPNYFRYTVLTKFYPISINYIHHYLPAVWWINTSPIQINFNKLPQPSSHGGAFVSRVVSSSRKPRRQTLQPLNVG